MFRRTFLSLVAAAVAVGFTAAAAGEDTLPGLDEALAAGSPVLIHVTAPWCGVCQAQKPIVAELLARPVFSQVQEFDVDFDTQKEILARFEVQSQSTMIVLKNGKEVDRQVGQTDPAVIESLLRQVL